MTAAIQIVVNGETREVPTGLGVTGLLLHLGLPAERVAIERNLEILPPVRVDFHCGAARRPVRDCSHGGWGLGSTRQMGNSPKLLAA